MKKLPPYAKPLFELLQQGLKPSNNINVFVGLNAWQKGKAFSISYPKNTISLPPYDCPSLYSWPVYNCDVIIIDTGNCPDDYINDLVYYLHINGAEKVIYVSPDYAIIKYEKDL